MSEREIRLDATADVFVRCGDRVVKNQVIGQKADGSCQPFLCPVDGVVREVVFDGEGHEFVVVIEF